MSNIKLNNEWHHEVIAALADCDIGCRFFFYDNFNLLLVDQNLLVIHLVEPNAADPAYYIALQQIHQNNHVKLIHLWQDVWISRPEQVIARISSILGLNKRIHGRKTKVQKIDKTLAESFLNENHLQGFVRSRYKLGLFEKNDLVAVATFSALRKMNYEADYKSAELIRFAVRAGYSVTGGLSKLIQHFYNAYQPNDLMSYADRDWSAGEAYAKIGFQQTAILAPQYYELDENLHRKLLKELPVTAAKVFNTGSLKYIFKF